MLDYEDGTMQTYPEYWMSKLSEGSKQEIYAIGGPLYRKRSGRSRSVFCRILRTEDGDIALDPESVCNRLLCDQPDIGCGRAGVCSCF